VRLTKLIELGGIYLDTDVIVHRDFDDLLKYSTVIGQKGVNGANGLCNGVTGRTSVSFLAPLA
jgi:mannosyltransferase OCH1-like enzyme